MRMMSLLVTTAIMSAPVSPALAKDEALVKAIAASHRTPAFVERDKARKPQEELEFFGIKPAMTVVEILPGGGYWTEILAPYLKGNGTTTWRCRSVASMRSGRSWMRIPRYTTK